MNYYEEIYKELVEHRETCKAHANKGLCFGCPYELREVEHFWESCIQVSVDGARVETVPICELSLVKLGAIAGAAAVVVSGREEGNKDERERDHLSV